MFLLCSDIEGKVFLHETVTASSVVWGNFDFWVNCPYKKSSQAFQVRFSLKLPTEVATWDKEHWKSSPNITHFQIQRVGSGGMLLFPVHVIVRFVFLNSITSVSIVRHMVGNLPVM